RSWIDAGQPTKSTSRRDIHGSKILLCI
ncbi:hypothetical protein EAI_00010, partial [Harpegnathos saltator]